MRTLLFLISTCAWAASVTTANYDLARTGANTAETTITQANVGRLHLEASLTVSGDIRNQPLVAENVAIPNVGTRTVAVFTTQDDNIYAFDADPARNGTSAYWSRNVGSQFIAAKMGCTPTPQIDLSTKVLYELCSGSTGTLTLYAIHLEDGTDYVSPVTISASNGGHTFSSLTSNGGIRPGLALANNRIYISMTDCEDSGGNIVCPERGWMMAYDKTNLSQVATWPIHAVWMAGGAPAVNSAGRLFVMTGNEGWNGTTQFGESMVKLGPDLAVEDFFTQSNWSALNGGDADMGSSRPVLLSDTRIIGGGKDGQRFLLNTADMGHLQGGGGTAPLQILATQSERNQIIFANNNLYIGTDGVGVLNAVPVQVTRYPYSNGTFGAAAAQTSGRTFVYAGTQLTYSSNGSTAGTSVLWGLTSATVAGPAVLRAWNADTLVEIWTSDQITSDAVGNYSRFAVPTVVNGKVYVPTASNKVQVYGLANGDKVGNGVSVVASVRR